MQIPDPFEAMESLRVKQRVQWNDGTSLDPVETQPITKGELVRLDMMVTCFQAMAELFSTDFADDAWNLRNSLVPYQPGDEHYDPDGDEPDDSLAQEKNGG